MERLYSYLTNINKNYTKATVALRAKILSIISSTTLSGVEAPEVTPTLISPGGSQFYVITKSPDNWRCSILLIE